MKKSYLNSFCFFCLCLSSLIFSSSSLVFAQAANPSQVCFKDRCVIVEVADNDDERTRGLQGRFTMNTDAGMLFVFQQQGIYNFWMKDTLIPLDILWLDKDGRVVDVKPNVPPCQENPCPIYNPSGIALYVLELNAGAAQSYNIQVGDQAVFN